MPRVHRSRRKLKATTCLLTWQSRCGKDYDAPGVSGDGDWQEAPSLLVDDFRLGVADIAQWPAGCHSADQRLHHASQMTYRF
jgi:hypothetical protein